jgi:hypothetical protein
MKQHKGCMLGIPGGVALRCCAYRSSWNFYLIEAKDATGSSWAPQASPAHYAHTAAMGSDQLHCSCSWKGVVTINGPSLAVQPMASQFPQQVPQTSHQLHTSSTLVNTTGYGPSRCRSQPQIVLIPQLLLPSEASRSRPQSSRSWLP